MNCYDLIELIKKECGNNLSNYYTKIQTINHLIKEYEKQYDNKEK